MNEEKMYIPSGLKTRDGKDIMCYTGEFYLKNKEKIDKLVKKCEEILKANFENDNSSKSQENATNILKEDSETYNLNTHLNKKHDKLFKEILSDKKEAVKFINHYLNLCLVESDIEKYEKEFRTNGFYNIEADIVYKLKEKNVFILIEHQSSVDLKMAYRVLCYKDAIETEDNNIISKFLEKIRNIEGGNEIMTNASRIINNEIRKQRREGKIEGIAEGKAEGKAEGIALIAKKLKGQMHIKDISQITGLSEEEIKAL